MPATFISLNAATNTFTMSPPLNVPNGAVFTVTDIRLSDAPQISVSSSNLKIIVKNQAPMFIEQVKN